MDVLRVSSGEAYQSKIFFIMNSKPSSYHIHGEWHARYFNNLALCFAPMSVPYDFRTTYPIWTLRLSVRRH